MCESREDVLRLQWAELKARQIMQAWGLRSWTFRFNRRRHEAGMCVFPSDEEPGRIELSRWFVLLNPHPEVLETVRHEVAHALVGHPYHDEQWMRMCRLVGARPERTCRGRMPEANWTASCPRCGATYARYRRPPAGYKYLCRTCDAPAVELRWIMRRGSVDGSDPR